MYLITRAEPGGAQTHLLTLARRMQHCAHCFLCVGERGFLTDALAGSNVDVTVVPYMTRAVSLWRDFRACVAVAAIIRRQKPELIHAHTAKAGFIGRLCGWLCGVPCVYTPHGWSFSDRSSPSVRVLSLILEKAVGMLRCPVIAVSEADKKLADKWSISQPSRIQRIYHGIPDSPHRARESSDGRIRIAMVSRLAQPKDHATLVQACAWLSEKWPIELILVGNGPLRAEIERLSKNLDMESRVHFLGVREDVATVLSTCQILALSSRWEAFGLSVLEGMRAGLPVIASEVGGIPELIRNGENGLLVPAGNAYAFARAIEQLLENEALRCALGRRARLDFETLFTEDRMIDETVRLYDHVVRLGRITVKIPLGRERARKCSTTGV